MLATIQIHVDGQWRTAATYEPANESEIAKGIAGGGRLLYEGNRSNKAVIPILI